MNEHPPSLEQRDDGVVCLHGAWTFAGLRSQPQLRAQLRQLCAKAQGWDVRQAELDSLGALWLWQDWQAQLPARLQASAAQQALWQGVLAEQAAAQADTAPARSLGHWHAGVQQLGEATLALGREAQAVCMLWGRVLLASAHVLRHPAALPWRELSANMYHAGVSALGITALVGLLIGVVLSYLSSQQLARYGANVLIVDLLGISILRELGPLLAAILVAGRSGSAMTAQLGTMKLNQELDALSALGISPTLRLAWPKTVALLLVMPLLAAWTSALALLGGMLAANWELGLSFAQFLDRFPRAVKLVHLWVGLGKSAVFGLLIGLIGCHFGLTAPPSSEGLGRATTRAVVAAITLVIVADALFAVLFSITLKPRP